MTEETEEQRIARLKEEIETIRATRVPQTEGECIHKARQ